MSHIDSNNPNSRNSRREIATADATEEVMEFELIEQIPNIPTVPAPAEQQEDTSEVVKETAAAPAKQQKEKKRTSAPAKQSKAGRPRKEKMDDTREKQPTVFRMQPDDHFRLKMMCLYNRFSMTDFLEELCLDAMDHSYRCRNAACNCEFIVRPSSTDADAELRCPACGNQKLDKVFKL